MPERVHYEYPPVIPCEVDDDFPKDTKRFVRPVRSNTKRTPYQPATLKRSRSPPSGDQPSTKPAISGDDEEDPRPRRRRTISPERGRGWREPAVYLYELSYKNAATFATWAEVPYPDPKQPPCVMNVESLTPPRLSFLSPFQRKNMIVRERWEVKPIDEPELARTITLYVIMSDDRVPRRNLPALAWPLLFCVDENNADAQRYHAMMSLIYGLFQHPHGGVNGYANRLHWHPQFPRLDSAKAARYRIGVVTTVFNGPNRACRPCRSIWTKRNSKTTQYSCRVVNVDGKIFCLMCLSKGKRHHCPIDRIPDEELPEMSTIGNSDHRPFMSHAACWEKKPGDLNYE